MICGCHAISPGCSGHNQNLGISGLKGHDFACNFILSVGSRPPQEYRDACDVMDGGVCNVDVDECSSSPCVHGALCLHSATDSSVPYDAFRCVCAAGFANGVCALSSVPLQYKLQCQVELIAVVLYHCARQSLPRRRGCQENRHHKS